MKDAVAVIFGFGMGLNALLFVPQALTIWRSKHAKGVSLLTFGGFNALQALGVLHGCLQHDWSLAAGMAVSLATCGRHKTRSQTHQERRSPRCPYARLVHRGIKMGAPTASASATAAPIMAVFPSNVMPTAWIEIVDLRVSILASPSIESPKLFVTFPGYATIPVPAIEFSMRDAYLQFGYLPIPADNQGGLSCID